MSDERAKILRRVARELGGDAVLSSLEALAPRDLGSLFLHLLARQADGAGPAQLLSQAETASKFAPSPVDPRLGAVVTGAAFEAAASFAAIELAPVAPLGTTRALTGLHADNVLAASRAAEVVADPAPLLALECAKIRRDERARPVRLCTSQRVIRMKPEPPPGLLPHFRLFAMATATARGPGVVAETLREHIAVYLTLFRLLGARGFAVREPVVSVSDTRAVERRLVAAGVLPETIRRTVRTGVFQGGSAAFGLVPLRGRAAAVLAAAPEVPPAVAHALEEIQRDCLDPLAAAFPEARFEIDLGRLEGLGYYPGPCLRINATDPSGAFLNLADGGFARWTELLLSDGRERFLASGTGTDLICLRFRAS